MIFTFVIFLKIQIMNNGGHILSLITVLLFIFLVTILRLWGTLEYSDFAVTGYVRLFFFCFDIFYSLNIYISVFPIYYHSFFGLCTDTFKSQIKNHIYTSYYKYISYFIHTSITAFKFCLYNTIATCFDILQFILFHSL